MDAGLGVVVGLQIIGAVVEQPGDGLDGDVVLVPVVGVGSEDDGVGLGGVGDQVRAAVSDVVRILAVEVIGSLGVEVSAELASLRLIVGAAQGEEGVVAEQGGEPQAGLFEGVLDGVVVKSLDADFSEVGDLAVDVSAGVDDLNAVVGSQAFQTAAGRRAGAACRRRSRQPSHRRQRGPESRTTSRPGAGGT